MNKLLSTMAVFVAMVFFSSCATIVGGSKYNAKVIVVNHPGASIEYRGDYYGSGTANFKAKRKEANNFTVTVSEEGCETKTTTFTGRKFRGVAFTASLLFWSGNINGFPVPWGVILDGATGAWFKPDKNEKGITKVDFNNYVYTIDYEGCKTKSTSQDTLNSKDKVEYLRELKKMLDEGVITKEEFEREKKKVLEGKN